MANITPFKALMPTPEKAHLVAAVPYDVVNRDEAAALADGQPLSFLHVSRSEIDLPDNIDVYSDPVYDKAQANFERLRQDAPLELDDKASFYVYSLVMNGHRQTGLVAAASVDDYDRNVIKKHELTRKDKEDDRTRHTLTIKAHSGPVFLTYKANNKIDEVIENTMRRPCIFDVTADDGIVHQVWRLPDADRENIQALFAAIDNLYVADGHHRAKSASRVREQCQANNPGHTGDEAYNRFLAVIFPADQLNILPYNRVIKDLNGLSTDQFLEKLQQNFKVEPTGNKSPETSGRFHMYLDHQWYCLIPHACNRQGSVVSRLDVSILQDHLLEPILGINDPRTDQRIYFIGGIHGPEKLEALVAKKEGEVAFSMFPVTVDELMEISDAAMIMPPKSTWFEPKLRDGLLIHCF